MAVNGFQEETDLLGEKPLHWQQILPSCKYIPATSRNIHPGQHNFPGGAAGNPWEVPGHCWALGALEGWETEWNPQQRHPAAGMEWHLLVIVTPEQLLGPEPRRIRHRGWGKKNRELWNSMQGEQRLQCWRGCGPDSGDFTVGLCLPWPTGVTFSVQFKGFLIFLTMGINRIATYMPHMTRTPYRSSCWSGEEEEGTLNPQGHLGRSLSGSR